MLFRSELQLNDVFDDYEIKPRNSRSMLLLQYNIFDIEKNGRFFWDEIDKIAKYLQRKQINENPLRGGIEISAFPEWTPPTIALIGCLKTRNY